MDLDDNHSLIQARLCSPSAAGKRRLFPFKRPRYENGPQTTGSKLTPGGKRHAREEAVNITAIYPLRLALRTADTANTDTPTKNDAAITSDCLPTIPGKHGDLKTVSVHTVSAILTGNQTAANCTFTIIDCRYPYEYEGGHIEGAINLYTREQIRGLLERRRQSRDTREILIFHCEFSCQRGPTLCRYLRGEDRAMNAENYPRLTFPEVYLMEGGYRDFYSTYQELCDPVGYTPMLHPDHKSELRRFRVNSTSRTTNGQKRKLSITPKAIRF